MSLKQTAKLKFLAVVMAFGCACGKPSTQSSALPFEWTNIVHGVSAFNKVPTTGTLIYFPNGSWFGQYPDRLTLGLGAADYEATVFYNPTNRAVTKIIQQTTIGTNHYWLIDTNGDGVPDERRKFGDQGDVRDLLVRGDGYKLAADRTGRSSRMATGSRFILCKAPGA